MDSALRAFVWRRAGDACEYCHLPQAFDAFPFQVDHIISEKHHGATAADNLALSCYHCNLHKGPNIAGIDPQSGQMTRLFHPRRDEWPDHFGWNEAEVRGLTPIGRTTIDVLQVNAPDRLQHRELLISAGLLPHRE